MPTNLAQQQAPRSAAVFSLFALFLTIPFNIYWTDPRQICTVGRTMAVDEQSKIIFRSLKSSDVATVGYPIYPQKYTEYVEYAGRFRWFYLQN